LETQWKAEINLGFVMCNYYWHWTPNPTKLIKTMGHKLTFLNILINLLHSLLVTLSCIGPRSSFFNLFSRQPVEQVKQVIRFFFNTNKKITFFFLWRFFIFKITLRTQFVTQSQNTPNSNSSLLLQKEGPKEIFLKWHLFFFITNFVDL